MVKNIRGPVKRSGGQAEVLPPSPLLLGADVTKTILTKSRRPVRPRKAPAAAGRQAAKTRRVRWVESDHPDNGHGVLFMHDELQRTDECVAFLEGFGWRDGGSATVRLLAICPPGITANHWSEMIQSAREAVLVFLSSEGKQKWDFRHGSIHIDFNG